jgi:MFS family permease
VHPVTALLRQGRASRVYFLALAQSSLGTGAGYVALLLIAYDRYESPWAISLVLLADLVPAMFLGPVFGAIADRWSRRWCAVLADLLRAVAFAGIALVDSFAATVALAFLAGAGTGLFSPATLAGLSSLVGKARLPAGTALYGAVTDLGYTLGPALAAAALLVVGPETLMAFNAATFAVSAALIAPLPFGAPARGRIPTKSLVAETRDGLRATSGIPGVRTIVIASGTVLFFGGLLNVAELLLAKEELDAGAAGLSLLVALFGLGFILGSLTGSRGGELRTLRSRYLAGILVMGVGLAATGLAPAYALALPAFALAGFGNGIVLVYERLLIQRLVPERLLGRVFGVKDAATAWAFGAAFLLAGGLIALLGTRVLLVCAGAGAVVVWALAGVRLRGAWREEDAPGASERDGNLARGGRRAGLGEHTAHVLPGGRDGWLALLDDLGEGDGNGGVELRAGVGR